MINEEFKALLKIWIPTFFIVLVINQSKYGNCYASHCLGNAFFKVLIISGVIAFLINKFAIRK